MIGDYQDPDEGALATGLEAFDTLNNVLEAHQVRAVQCSVLLPGERQRHQHAECAGSQPVEHWVDHQQLTSG